MIKDKNALSYWFPHIADAGLPVPATRIIPVAHDLRCLMDMQIPEGWDDLVEAVTEAAGELGYPAFLRTGHLSGKHRWKDACYLDHPENVQTRLARLVEESEMAGIFGLPCDEFAVRQFLKLKTICTCAGYGDMPVGREFRFFANENGVEHWQPYWPPESVRQGYPSEFKWRAALQEASRLSKGEERMLGSMAIAAAAAVDDDSWSVDFLQDTDGIWWLTDMAEGIRSFRWDPAWAEATDPLRQ